jgi:hypothetical protein
MTDIPCAVTSLMPKQPARSFSDEFLRSQGIYSLDPETPLFAEEAAVLLSCSTDKLERARKAGDPPPFHQERPRGAVRYALGDVLKHRGSHKRTSSAEVWAEHHDRLLGITAFSQLLMSGRAESEWPYVLVGKERRPIDFFASLTLPSTERRGVKWMSLAAYFAEALRAVERLPAVEDAEERAHMAVSYGQELKSKKQQGGRTRT